ncbi:cadherin-19-like [Watersipora subatra]|uniref:cadherin-19-like n=1 Tax=Watersipora subatra TaxID=2589382 RepID=UPI00355C8771
MTHTYDSQLKPAMNAPTIVDWLLYGLTADSELPFAVDPVTGVIQVAGPLDFETVSQFQFTLQAVDSGVPALSATTLVRVHLTDINDNRPVFSQLTYLFEVEESAPGGTIGRVFASDADERGAASITYSLSEESELFDVEINSGVVLSLQSLDRETADEYKVSRN